MYIGGTVFYAPSREYEMITGLQQCTLLGNRPSAFHEFDRSSTKKVTHDDNVAVRLSFGISWCRHMTSSKVVQTPVTISPYTTTPIYAHIQNSPFFTCCCYKADRLNICMTVLADQDQKATTN
jgi:hypothetical protein